MIRIAYAVALTLTLGVVVNCTNPGGRNDPNENKTGLLPGPSEQPPAGPARRDVPVDEGLVKAAREELSRALRSSDPLMRIHTLEALKEAGEAGQSKEVLRALGDNDPGVRFAAAMAAGEMKLEAARDPLLRIVKDPDRSVQVAVRFALHKLGDTRRSHYLEKTARNPDALVRRNTALVLGLLGEPSATKILNYLALDRDAAVRQQAAESMWRLVGDKEALNQLVGMTVSQYPDDRMFALLALAAPGNQQVRQHVRVCLTTEYQEVNLVAARAMGMLGSDEGYGVAVNGTKSKDPLHRFLAARAFGAIGRTDAQPVLKTLLTDSDPHVRMAAASAVLQLRK